MTWVETTLAPLRRPPRRARRARRRRRARPARGHARAPRRRSSARAARRGHGRPAHEPHRARSRPAVPADRAPPDDAGRRGATSPAGPAAAPCTCSRRGCCRARGERRGLARDAAAHAGRALRRSSSSPRATPPCRRRGPRAATLRAARWAWLVAGAAQWFSGQTAHARPAIARRLREGARPGLPAGAARRGAARRHRHRPRRARGGRAAPRFAWLALPPRRPARGARVGLRRPRDGPHRGNLARAPGADGGPLTQRGGVAPLCT